MQDASTAQAARQVGHRFVPFAASRFIVPSALPGRCSSRASCFPRAGHYTWSFRRQPPRNRTDVDIDAEGNSTGDGILDFADGFNAFGDTDKDTQVAGLRFVPVALRVSGIPNGSTATVTFDYDGADPASVARTAITTEGLDGQTYTTHDYQVGEGLLRLWRKPADAERTVSDYIVPGQPYTAAELGSLLYLEAVNGAGSATVIAATLDVSGGQREADAVNVLPLDPLIGLNELKVHGYEIIRNTTGSVSLEGTSGKDILIGTEAHEIINGNGEDDIILAGRNTTQVVDAADDPDATKGDQIDGGAGSDLIFSWFGNNTIVPDPADEISLAEGYGFNGFFGPPPAAAPAGVAAAAPERDGQVFISKQVEAAYKQMYGADDIWLQGFKELGGKVLAVRQDGKWFSNWTIKWKKPSAISSYTGYDVRIEHDIGGVMVAAATLRQAIMSTAYWDSQRWGDFFQAQNMQEIADGVVYGEALEAWTELRTRNFEQAKQVATLAAQLYVNGMTLAYGAAGEVADLVIAMPQALDGDFAAMLAMLPLIPASIAPLGRARALVDWGFGKFRMIGANADVLLRDSAVVGFVLRYDLIKATGETIAPRLKRVDAPNGKGAWVVGDPQKIYSNGVVTTHGAAHAAAIQGKADDLAATGNYSHITMNRGLNTATGRLSADATRPDIIAVRWDGKVEMFEYLSPPQTRPELRAKMEAAMNTLPQQYRTDVMIVLDVP